MAKYTNPWINDPVVEPPINLEEMADRTQFIVGTSMVRQKWQLLEEITDAYLENIVECRVLSLNLLFDQYYDISVISPLSVMAKYAGSSRDGCIELYAEGKGEKQHFLNGLSVGSSLEGIIEIAYVAWHIYTKHAHWHGRYGRAYTMLVDHKQLTDRNIDCRVKHEHDMAMYYKDIIERPLGIRVSKRNGRHYLSCLSLYYDGDIVDKTVRLESGRVINIQPEIVFEAPSHIMY